MELRQFRYGADNLGYLMWSGSSTMAVDGGAVKEMLSFLEEYGLTLVYVVNTHSHGHHTCGNSALLEATGAKFLGFEELVREGSLELGGERIRVLNTPGHTGDCICFTWPGVLLSGDTLFNGKVGRCFTGDVVGMYHSIQKLLELPDETVVYAGHDYLEEYLEWAGRIEPGNPHIADYLARYSPEHVRATLAEERLVDPFLRLNEPTVVRALQERGLLAGTELERWTSLVSVM